MTWHKTPADRARDAKVYGSAEYKRNREAAKRRAGGVCEGCQHRHTRLQCDHRIPVSQGGGHELANLTMLCVGSDSCKCHERKTAQEGGGARARQANTDPRPRQTTLW